ncbi:MAG: class I SAM-dependent methyltransferase [Gemmatimonadaceae bacterium]|nr:class I SAM-dependent methyltransferase [Gemmatimonadaceae bacterium]
MTGGYAEEMRRLEESLRRRFRVVETPIEVGGRTIALLHPASAEELISEADFDRDERLPYWAEPWPSSFVLAREMVAERWGAGRGRSLLELGCGAGLVTTAAAMAGFDVTASDYYEDALRFARLNAWRAAGREVRPLLLDWRALPQLLPRYDFVVAADVLYERPYAELVARAVARTLAPRGLAIVADPGRVAASAFVVACPAAGLNVAPTARLPYQEGAVRQTIDVYELRPAVAG